MTTTFNYDPYYDDFDEDKNFMRVLFRPGYAVQARELTQLQTILTSQIEKLGNHIFKSGSPIVGGKVMLDDRAFYLVLNSQYSNQDIVPDDFLDRTIISYNSTKSVRAKVIAVDTTSEKPILVLKYLSGEQFSESDELKVNGANIFAQVAPTNAVGRSYVASIQEGVYYFKGQFVKVVPQFLVLELFYKIGYNAATVNVEPSYKIGIEFDTNIIDEIDDVSLLDPAQGAFNYQAPGATRYQVATRLSKRTLDSDDESSFFEVIRLVNGVKTKEIDYPIYSEIEKTLARRTYDESGNYTVDPFVLALEEGDSANGKFNVVLDPGKAYVGGYEFQTIAPTTIELNRSRATSNTSDFSIPTNYTSYIVLDTIVGSLDISTFPKLDLHCVEGSRVNVQTTAAYNSTKIGTVRADMMKYNDATDVNIGNTHSFILNVFEPISAPITGTIPSSGSTSNVIKLPADFSSIAGQNAYAGMYFTLTDNSGLGRILITESNAGVNTITLQESLPFTPASNTFAIETNFATVESVINRSGQSILFSGNINSDSKDSANNSFITEPNRSGLIFDLPFEAIKEGTITDYDFYARKVYSGTSSGGKITIGRTGTDTFPYGTSSMSDSVILDNIICFIKSGANSQFGIAPNTVLSLANSNFSVTATSTSIEIDFNTPIGDVITADFIITTKINDAENGSSGAIRRKQMVPDNTNVNLHAKVPYELDPTGDTLDPANSSTKTAFTGGYVFNDIGSTVFNTSAILKELRTPGKTVSLQVPDVYEIVKIVDSKSPTQSVTTAMLNDKSYEVTSYYEFDNGQRKTHYDHATIKLKRNYSSPQGQIYVQYRYKKHISAPSPQNKGLFTVDSYVEPYSTDSNMTYGDISVFVDKDDNKTYELRSSFDFRPTRGIASDTLSGAVNVDPDLVGQSSFEYYLSRIDNIVVKPSKEFSVVEGKSAVEPIPPTIGDSDMLIHTLSLPAYTESVKDIRVDYKNNRRYTMRDIGIFENRIKQLEYYVSLNSLEKDASTVRILDNNGLERSKYGILVDNFSSTVAQASYGDVGYDNRNLIEENELKPASLMRTFKMNVISNACSGSFNIVGKGEKKLLMLDYTTKEFASQKFATKSIAIAGALFANFNGSMKLYPEYSADVDTDVTARVTLNSLQGLDSAFAFINDAFKYIADQEGLWSTDKDSPFAKVATTSWYTTKTDTARRIVSTGNRSSDVLFTTSETSMTTSYDYKQKSISTSSSQVEVGSFVTDLAIQPYIKPRNIIFSSVGLRPNTLFYHFFDGQDINNLVEVPNKVTLNVSSSAFNAGEICLIAGTTGDLSANLSSYLSGGNNFVTVAITSTVSNSNSVMMINESGLPLANKYMIGLDNLNVAVISTVDEHRSGQTRSINSTTITLASDAPSVNISGNTIYLVHSTDSVAGFGDSYNIVDYNVTTKAVTVEGNITANTSKQYIYSIGQNRSDQFGQVSGVFYIPSATFRSGERTLRVTGSFNNTFDKDNISFADKTYVSSGLSVSKTELVDTVYNVDFDAKIVGGTTETKLVNRETTSTVLSSRRTTNTANLGSGGDRDPLAQTFYVDPQVYPNGTFISDVDLYFRAKDDDNLPVTIQIRPTVNGAPSSDFWYPESVVTKYPDQIVTSDNPDVTTPTHTNFAFDTPVFLKPGLYAVVILTSSPDYTVWIAEKGATTTKNEFVGVNPYVGTLYRSQNAMEYVPSINEDLMFRINRCSFSNSPATFSVQNQTQSVKYAIDKFRLIDTEINPLSDAPITCNFSIISKQYDGSKETAYRGITTHTTYSMGSDVTYSVGNRRKELKDQGDFTVQIEMQSSDDAITPVVSTESLYLNAWENFVDDATLREDNFNIIEPGSGYTNANTIIVNSSNGTGANVRMNVDANGNVVSINVISGGTNYTDDFTITYDDTSTWAGISANAVITLNSEYDSSGGPCDARYITKPIVLADGFDAGDLRVFLSANKPGNSEIHVFYKILSVSDGTNFKDRPYMKMECFNPTNTPSLTEYDYREYEYRPSLFTNAITYTNDDGATFDSFKTFAIKIVMTSTDPAVVPKVKDLRIIALPAE